MTNAAGPDVGLILRAAEFAADRHRKQRRKDVGATPYINHPLALASVLANAGGIHDAEIIAAALLHDTIEDTNTTPSELRAAFGERVASIVAEVSDDPTMTYTERKNRQIERAPHISREAKLVKLADKICNLRDVADNPPHDWPLRRRRDYFDWADRVVAGIRGTHAALEAVYDEVAARRP